MRVVLEKLLKVLSANVINQEPICIGMVNKKINHNGLLTDEALRKKLKNIVDLLL